MAVYALDGVSPQLPSAGEYWIAPSASVIGDVRLEKMASVWFGAVLRGDNEAIIIGERSNVQDNCVLHTDPGFPMRIGRNVTIGHQATLHGCTVGDGALIGMGATVLNGAVIGRNAVIGAHALVPEGKEIPDNALVVGTPGKVARILSDEQAAEIEALAAHYVDRIDRYNKGLELVPEIQLV